MDDYNKSSINIRDMLLPADINTLIENVKGKLKNKKSDTSLASTRVRIPDLNVNDKKKILDLIDVLAKVNAEKEKITHQLNASKQQIETYKTQLALKDEDQSKLISDLKIMIEQLENKIKSMEDKKDMEVTVLRTQHEIDMKKVVYNNSLQTQKLQNRMMEDLQYQKRMYEAQIDQLKRNVADLESKTQIQLNKLAERNKLSNNLISILEKEKYSLEERLNVARGKLKVAVSAIQKLKMKIQDKAEKKSHDRTQSSQTVLSMLHKSKHATAEKIKSKSTKSNTKLTEVEMTEDAIISEIFFHKDSLTEMIGPIFYPDPPMGDRSKDERFSDN